MKTTWWTQARKFIVVYVCREPDEKAHWARPHAKKLPWRYVVFDDSEISLDIIDHINKHMVDGKGDVFRVVGTYDTHERAIDGAWADNTLQHQQARDEAEARLDVGRYMDDNYASW